MAQEQDLEDVVVKFGMVATRSDGVRTEINLQELRSHSRTTIQLGVPVPFQHQIHRIDCPTLYMESKLHFKKEFGRISE